MKRLLVFLLFYIMMATSPSWADTTNSGATTNTQTNTSGAIIPLYQFNYTVRINNKQYQSTHLTPTSTTNTTRSYSD